MSYSSKQQQIKEAIEIFKNNQIEIEIFGCGCCGSPSVNMKYQGKTIIDEQDDCNIDTNETITKT